MDNDSQVQSLDESKDYDMMSVGGNSMASISMASENSRMMGASDYDDASAYSGSDI